MPELRLTLLVVGLVFLVGLAWWELRRPRQVRGSDLPRSAADAADRPVERTADWDLPSPSALHRSRNPELELPRMSARDPEQELPLVEVGAAEFAALEARAEVAPAPEPAPEEQTAENTAQIAQDDFAEDFADDLTGELAGPTAAAEESPGMDGLLEELGSNQSADPPISDIGFEAVSEPQPRPEPVPEAAATPPGPVIVEWPAPGASQVLAVRVISVGEKFSGRAVRMAVAAEGFVLGKFEIFHKPAADGRALLSIASLNEPGSFDVRSIDVQRYSGLNLFAVLPGPMPGPAAVEELLACAQVLAQRLRAVLQDEQGAPLSPSRTAALRTQAAAAPA